MTGLTMTGTYRPCLTCQAPAVDPFPGDWELEVIKEGPPSGPVRTYATPHRPGCTAPYADPQPGVALRIPGDSVTRLAFNPAPTAALADPGYLFYAPLAAGSEEPAWTPLGYVADDGGEVGTRPAEGV